MQSTDIHWTVTQILVPSVYIIATSQVYNHWLQAMFTWHWASGSWLYLHLKFTSSPNPNPSFSCGGSVRMVWRPCSTNYYKSFTHDNVIKWKYFPRYWPFVRWIHRSPVNSPHKGQWRELCCFLWSVPWINSLVNNCEAGDLRRNRAHYDVIVMPKPKRAKPEIFYRKLIFLPQIEYSNGFFTTSDNKEISFFEYQYAIAVLERDML